MYGGFVSSGVYGDGDAVFPARCSFCCKGGVLDGAAPDDDAEDASINSFFDIVHGVDAAARLDGDGDGFADGADEGRIHALSFEGAVKVDDVKEFRAGFLEGERGFHGVFPVDGDVAGLSLAEADAAAVLDVYSRKYDHSLNHSSMFRNNRAPMAPDFSGWNWRPMTFPFPTIAGMGTP